MNGSPLTAVAWSQLAASITRWTGFHPDAIGARAVLAALAPLLAQGIGAEEVAARAQRDDPALRTRLTQAVPVAETYFFRTPEHFAFVRERLAPGWAADAARPRSVWSAGCAEGEETYSLAAVLHASGVRSFEVVGTDLVEANVEAARAGRYGPWSLRGTVPVGEDPFLPAAAGAPREIAPALRARTRFEVHNLLDGAPAPGQFDLIFCRNVLIYFTEEARQRALATLASALAPGGVVAFATMDVSGAVPPLVRIGAPELQLFERPAAGPPRAAPAAPLPPARHEAPPAPAAARPRPRTRGSPAPVAAAAPRAAAADPVTLHLRALGLLERGEHARARDLLAELERGAPQYLPGLLEAALLHAREGRRARAAELMRSVLALARAVPADALVAGPETLPATFYATAARTFLGAEVPR